MKKYIVVTAVIQTVEHRIPKEVSQWIQAECPIVINDLNDWDLHPRSKSADGKVLLGIFGLEGGNPIIGLDHRTLKTIKEVVGTTMHEVAHAWLWHLGKPNGERITNRLAKEWMNNSK